jgi:hypothetical protein
MSTPGGTLGWGWAGQGDGDAQLAEGAGADGYGVVAGGGSERGCECEWAADAHRAGAR